MAEGGSQRDTTRFNTFELRMMLLLLVVGELAAIVAAVWTRHNSDLSKIFTTAAVTLLFGSLLGGVVTLLIADFDRRRGQRAARRDFITNLLADLKAVHDQVDRGRMLIQAHKSAKTYGEQMREYIEARVKLRNVERALETDERAVPIQTVSGEVARMEQYLHGLLQEYEANYKDISLAQSIFEAKMKQILQGPQSLSVEALPENEPWNKIERLEHVLNAEEYDRNFRRPLDDASRELRNALAAQLC